MPSLLLKSLSNLTQAAAPQPPQIEPNESLSTSSLVDVDTPSVRSVPSDFKEQDVQTQTQADRISREEQAKAQAKAVKDKAAAKAKKADTWLTRQFADMSEGASSLLVVVNFVGVACLGLTLGYKAWGLYERGRLGWQQIGLGAGIVAGVAGVEAFFAK